MKYCFIGFFLFLAIGNLSTQTLDSVITRTRVDTSKSMLNQDAVYNRPFLTFKKAPISLGGYLEVNSIYSSEEGVSEGLSFQARRLTIFLSSSVTKRIKFLTEIEFEDGTKEIQIEFAALDVAFHTLFNFRGGIVMIPIGAFNQNHDGPKWEFVERPDVAENMLPATWSNAGFGVYGKTYRGNWVFGYETYLTNGFNDNIIDNEESKTFLPAAKNDENRFEESNSGEALVSGKIAIKNRKIGEIGFSYMGGVYNKYKEDGLIIDDKRRVDVFAFDLNSTIKKTNTYIVGEIAFNKVNIPSTYTQQYGDRQWGAYVDIVQPIIKREMFNWENASFNVAMRLDYVDWNVGKFKESGTNIGDDIFAVTPALSFRTSAQTVFRLNYRYQWQKDIINNPAVKSASWLFGLSSYF